MDSRLNFRIPMFTDKDSFDSFQYIELGEQIECTLCGYDKEPQQCTGLKDKNGKFIYEGDILLSPDGDYPYRVLVDWFGEEAKFVVNAWNGKEFEYLLSDDEPQDLENFEVIGNIYENSDLLSEVEG